MTWFDELPARVPRIDMHPSGLLCRHDQLCAACGNQKAIYRMDIGIFEPCGACHQRGWRLKRPRKLVPQWLLNALEAQGEG